MKNILFALTFISMISYCTVADATYRTRGYDGSCAKVSDDQYDFKSLREALDVKVGKEQVCDQIRIKTEVTLNLLFATYKKETAWVTMLDAQKKETMVTCTRTFREIIGKYHYNKWGCDEKDN
ncbi:MAG: hypothetical protein HQK84_07830 [Nitrospinae bacterium]|nr:hypothetical protein [Nitrospinota bacterium]